VIRLLLAEAVVLAIIGSLTGIGTAAGILVIYQDYIIHGLQVPFIIPSVPVILAGGGSALLPALGIAAISSLYPAYLVIRSEPYETIRMGGP
jgi:ABC-type antimicrobial peptide transport system permease subunit